MGKKDTCKKLKDGTLKFVVYGKDGEELSRKLIAIGVGYKLITDLIKD